jgi:hypothetical protein
MVLPICFFLASFQVTADKEIVDAQMSCLRALV